MQYVWSEVGAHTRQERAGRNLAACGETVLVIPVIPAASHYW